MKSTTFFLGAFLASVAIAQPHKQHRHAARHNKRDAVATSLAIVTDWVTETEIVGYTETIWVTPGFVEPEATSTTSSLATTTSSTSTTPTFTSTSQSAAQFFEPASTSSTQAPPKPSTTSSISSSTPSPVYVAPTTSPASSVYVAPVESTSSIAPVVVPTTTTPVAVYTPPVETTTSSAVAATTSAASNSGSSSGTWSSGSPASGDLTWYDTGLGACGENTDGTVEKVVALPSWLMGTQSNGNPYCGKTVTISYQGKTTTATVVDKCPGCLGNHIDLSKAAFLDLADLGLGKAQNAEWHFN